MAKTWGSTALQILVGSLKPGSIDSTLTETPVLPDPSALSSISTVVQQAGRKREKMGARLYVDSMSKYLAFVTDKHAGTLRTLVIDLTSTNGTYWIDSIGEPEFKRHDMIFFDIVWMEAS